MLPLPLLLLLALQDAAAADAVTCIIHKQTGTGTCTTSTDTTWIAAAACCRRWRTLVCGSLKLSRDPPGRWLASSQLRREKMRYLALRYLLSISVHLSLYFCFIFARLTIASHNIFLRTPNEGEMATTSREKARERERVAPTCSTLMSHSHISHAHVRVAVRHVGCRHDGCLTHWQRRQRQRRLAQQQQQQQQPGRARARCARRHRQSPG